MTQSKPKFRRETLWPFLLAGTITLCSGFPAAVPDLGWLQPDKVGHLIAYGVLATSLARHSSVKVWPWLGLGWAGMLASVYGLGDEIRQGFTGIRFFDWADWAADTVGAVVAVGLYSRWSWYRRVLETPLWKKRPKVTTDPEGRQSDLTTKNTNHTK